MISQRLQGGLQLPQNIRALRLAMAAALAFAVAGSPFIASSASANDAHHTGDKKETKKAKKKKKSSKYPSIDALATAQLARGFTERS